MAATETLLVGEQPVQEPALDHGEKKRKRKRNDDEDNGDGAKAETKAKASADADGFSDEAELEINLAAPEPLSRKALRQAKKRKTGPEPEAGKPEAGKRGTTDGDGSADDAAQADTARSAHGIWIGNLAFTVSKSILRDFFSTAAPNAIPPESITRVHMPAPKDAKASRTTLKPVNKGFAYVDFATQEAWAAALLLSESQLAARAVLIKDAKSFAGRPDKAAEAPSGTKAAPGDGRPVSRRIFVGNLGYDVTKEDLAEHFGQCGAVEDIHMATFEDSGKCKGFAWVTFGGEGGGADKGKDSALSAVRGFIFREAQDGDEGDGAGNEAKKPAKRRKWFVNRLQGRPLRCEFAEDSSTRYKKRFGKEGRPGVDGDAEVSEVPRRERRPERAERPERPERIQRKDGLKPGEVTDPSLRRGRNTKQAKLHEQTRYRTGVIAEAQGTRTTFD